MLETLFQHQYISLALLLVGLYYVFHTRFIGHTPLVNQYPTSILLLDVLLLPTLCVLLVHLIERISNYPLFNRIELNFKLVQQGVLFLLIFWLIARAFDVIIMQRFFRQRTGYDAPHLLRGLAYGLTMFSGLALFLWKIEYPLTGFLVSTGVIAGIVGLAMQNTLGNLFSGIAFSLERPFKTGDWVELNDGTIGQVIEMTWRSTWFKTFNNTIMSVPNLVLASQAITNLDRPTAPYSVWYTYKLSPEIDPAYVKTLLASAVGRCHHVLPKPAPSIRLNSAIKNPYIYTVWVHYRNYLAHFKGQDELSMQIHHAFSQAGIHVSAEVQEISVARKKAMSPETLNIGETLKSLRIFAELDEQEIAEIAAKSEYLTVDAEKPVMIEHQKATHVYVVVNGELESSITAENKRKVIGETFVAGDSFGWSSIVIEEDAFMTVTAISDSLVLAIHGQCLKPILNRHPELISRFTNLVSQRIQHLKQAKSLAMRQRKLYLNPNEIKKRIERFLG